MSKPKPAAAPAPVPAAAPAPIPAPSVPVANTAPAPAPVPAYNFRFALESGIAIPVRKRGGSRSETAYPFKVMEVGHSFFVPSSDTMKEPWKTLTSLASRIARELHPKQFTTARMKNENGVEGVRVWRVDDTKETLKPPREMKRKAKNGEPAEGSKEALAREAAEGDTSNNVKHHAPDFEGATAPDTGQAPPPPPPPAG